jgi:hypothetical protein
VSGHALKGEPHVIEEQPGEAPDSTRPQADAPTRIFISYRRADSAGDARALYYALAARYGAENVFLDVVTLLPGTKWLDDIKSHGAASGVFLALIGPQWMSTMSNRGHAGGADPADDYVRLEIESALGRGSGVEIIPVLIDDAPPPDADKLRPSLGRLAAIQLAPLRHTRWDDDVANLLEQIDRVAAARTPLAAPTASATPRQAPPRAAAAHAVAPEPDAEHYAEVVKYMAEEGTVVPILGSRVNAGDREQQWAEDCGYLPDADELAADLAQRITATSRPADLAGVSQYVYVTQGRPDLYRRLGKLLGADCPPSSVHRFFATFPARLEEHGHPRRYQLIVTGNYDNALERAFADAGEPYDLAVYMASGEHKGKFLHLPYDAEPRPIDSPNDYRDLPIDDDYELERTVIVKIHGAVDNVRGPVRWKENYVITEDHYIDYLSGRPIAQLVPNPILDKVRESHCLFLGYTMRDWSLRVFLKRIWEGQPLDAKSWAIEPDPDVLEEKLWSRFGVDPFAAPLADYVRELTKRSAAYLAERKNVPPGP